MEAVDSVELLEGLLDGQEQLGGGGVGLERLAMEFNRLRHNVKTADDVPLVQNMLPVSMKIVLKRTGTCNHLTKQLNVSTMCSSLPQGYKMTNT